jgi:hypothetical protein
VILAVLSQSPFLVFERKRARNGFVPFFAKSPNVIGMENTCPKIVGSHVVE